MAKNVIQVDIKGIKELRKNIEKYPQIAKPIVTRVLRATEAIFAKNTLRDDPVPFRTGNLLQSFRHSSSSTEARWFPLARYAKFVEQGRGWVYPVRAKVLRWKGPSGEYIYAKRARPTKPNPFMKKIAKKSEPEIVKIFKQANDKIISQIARK